MNKTFPKTLEDVEFWLLTNLKPTMALDTETDGLHYGCALKGFSVCNGAEAMYVNFEFFQDEEIREIIKLLKRLIELQVHLLILHNAPFDLRVLKSVGINYTGKLWDTQVGAHLLNENASCALKKLAVRVLKIPEKEVVEFKKAIEFGYSSEKFLDYAINDVIWTWKLYEIEKPNLEKQQLTELFIEVEMPFQYVLLDMFEAGIKIDQEKLKTFEELLTVQKSELEKQTIESIGLKMIEEQNLFGFSSTSCPMNLNSDQQVAKVIEEKLDVKLPRTPPSKTFPEGQPSTSSETLEPIRGKHPFIDSLLQYRKIDKLLSTFISPLWERIDKDGRVRTSFNDTVARTGRLSSSSPNLQNIPKEFSKNEPVNVRELFVPKDGYVFVTADYESQELRQLANLTKDKNLIGAFNENKDLHLYTANEALGLHIDQALLIKTADGYSEIKDKYKKERHIGKNGINFPIVYGSTAYGIAKNNNVAEEIAQSWLDGFFKTYPEVKTQLHRCKKELFTKHYVRNYFGRKRRFGEIDNGAIRQGFNFWIQGFCADLLRIALVRLRELYLAHPEWDTKLVLTVHDDCTTEVKMEYAEECLKAKKEVLENIVNLDVPFLVDIKICRSYAE